MIRLHNDVLIWRQNSFSFDQKCETSIPSHKAQKFWWKSSTARWLYCVQTVANKHSIRAVYTIVAEYPRISDTAFKFSKNEERARYTNKIATLAKRQLHKMNRAPK